MLSVVSAVPEQGRCHKESAGCSTRENTAAQDASAQPESKTWDRAPCARLHEEQETPATRQTFPTTAVGLRSRLGFFCACRLYAKFRLVRGVPSGVIDEMLNALFDDFPGESGQPRSAKSFVDRYPNNC